MLRFKNGKFFPTSFKPAIQYEISNIINYLKSIFRGIANYYGIAHNWYDAKSIYNYYGLFVVAMTIAHKIKSKVPKIFKKYGPTLKITDQNNNTIAHYGKLTNSNFKKSVNINKPYKRLDVSKLLKQHLKIARKALIT